MNTETYTPEDAASADARNVSFLLGSKAWSDFLEPFMLGCIQRWYRQLADPALARKATRPDDYLRGCIKAYEELLRLPHDVIAIQEKKNEYEKDARTEEEHYARIAREGRGPTGTIPYEGISPSDPI